MTPKEAILVNSLLRAMFVTGKELPPSHAAVYSAAEQLAAMSSKALKDGKGLKQIVKPADLTDVPIRGWKSTTRTEADAAAAAPAKANGNGASRAKANGTGTRRAKTNGTGTRRAAPNANRRKAVARS